MICVIFKFILIFMSTIRARCTAAVSVLNLKAAFIRNKCTN